MISTGYLHTHEIRCLMSSSACLVLASFEEGFGFTVVEAMAAGLPVICSSGSSLNEVAGSAAEFVEPRDTSDIVRALELVLTNKERASELRSLGLEQSKRFDWDRTAEATLAFYRRVLGKMNRASARTLRIGIDGRELEGRPTGVGRYLRSLLRRFVLHDRHQFVIYSASQVGLPVESPRLETRVLPGEKGLIWEQRTLPGALHADRIDVLLSPAYSCPVMGSVRRVTAIHDLSFFAHREEFGLLHGLRRRAMARLSARVSYSILACSVFTKGEIRRHLGETAAAKTEVVLLGPDDDLPPGPGREAARVTLGLDEGAPYIVTVGTVLRRRNVSTLVRAVARLRERHPGVRLGIVGENRSHPFEDLTALTASLGWASAVQISGFVSDELVALHYAAADVAVFLSEYEGFGLPALEAMSRGVPTLIANRGSLNELFSNGALVVEPDETLVADALSRVLSDSVASADLREAGREAAKDFSWERAAAQTLAVLERAAS